MRQLMADLAPLMAYSIDSEYARRAGDPAISDFVFGNPHEPPLEGFVEALSRSSRPQDNAWYAYKLSVPRAVAAVVPSLRERTGVPFDPQDVLMTNGAFTGTSVALRTVLDPDDEVIMITPPWFFYDPLIRLAGGRTVRVASPSPSYELPTERIAKAITGRTRAVIVNTPHNPTGRIYGEQELRDLATTLAEASDRNGRRIYVISDESYSRIVYDDRTFHSPAALYPSTFLVYTYGKTLLTPGARLGYLALPPSMPDRDAIRAAVMLGIIGGGWAFPNAVLQHALPDIEPLSVDVKHLQRKRDRMVEELRAVGYELTVPEGTFYVPVRSPWEDDMAFSDLLATHDIFVLPGSLTEMPGYFRISLTASEDMIERSLPGFRAALDAARRHPPAGGTG
jgi:aspartate aminotransferase